MVVTEEEQSGHDPLKQLGSRPFVKRRDGGSRTRSATGYEPVPGTTRIAAMSRILGNAFTLARIADTGKE